MKDYLIILGGSLVIGLAFAFAVVGVPPEAQAQQAPEWRELGGVNGVELYEVRTGRAVCYVSSAGGVSCK